MMHRRQNDIHTACLNGTFTDVERCLRDGENVNRHNENGLTPLHVAVQRQLSDVEAILEFLLKNEADVNAQTLTENETPLQLAVKYGRRENIENIAKILIKHGASTRFLKKSCLPYCNFTRNAMITSTRTQGIRDEQLHTACLNGQVSVIEKCLRSGEDVNRHNENGLTPLHVAVQRQLGDVEAILEFLLKNEADVNAQTVVENETPLHLAIKYGRRQNVEDIVEKLMEYGADTSLRNRNLRRPYDLAVSRGLAELADLLASSLPPAVAVEQFRKNRAQYYGKKLVKAVISGDITTILSCLSHKADINYKDQTGSAAIHHVIVDCPRNKSRVLDILKDAGANVNLQNQELDTVLNLTIKASELRGNGLMYKLAEKLLDWGVDYNLKNAHGEDAWKLCEERRYNDILALLRKRNASFPDLLFNSILFGNANDVREAISSRDVNVNARNKNGYCPIHLSVLREDENDKAEIIDILHSYKADMDALTSNERQSALHLAAIKNDVIAAKKLIQSKIKLTTKDKEGHTARASALASGSTEVAEMIAEASNAKTCCIT